MGKNDLKGVLESMKKLEREKKFLNKSSIDNLKKSFKNNVEGVKNFEKKWLSPKKSPKKQGKSSHQAAYVDTQYTNRGIDESKDKFMADELCYIERTIQRVKQVRDLDFPHLKYLVVDRFF